MSRLSKCCPRSVRAQPRPPLLLLSGAHIPCLVRLSTQITLAETHISSTSSSSSSSAAQQLTLATQENFEPLGPIIRQLHEQGLEDVFLKSLDKFVEDKEGDIEKICGENYQVRPLKRWEQVGGKGGRW